jgi:hypothetical protein
MTLRSLETRVLKLEASRRRPNEMLETSLRALFPGRSNTRVILQPFAIRDLWSCDAVTVRSLEARVRKLEFRRRRPDEMLVIWRRPDGDIAESLRGASFAKGDRVLCIEWLGDDPLPEPRCHSRFLKFSDVENGYVERAIDRLKKAMEKAPAVARRRQRSHGLA